MKSCLIMFVALLLMSSAVTAQSPAPAHSYSSLVVYEFITTCANLVPEQVGRNQAISYCTCVLDAIRGKKAQGEFLELLNQANRASDQADIPQDYRALLNSAKLECPLAIK